MSSANLVVLGFDSLRHEIPDAVIGGVPVMPTLAELTSRSVSFASCHAVSPTCIPSRVGFATGRYPMHGGHRTSTTTIAPWEPDLVSYVRERGYTTALVGLNHMASAPVLDRMFTHHRRIQATPSTGAEVYDGMLDLDPDDWDQARTTAAAEAMLDALGSSAPFLLMVNWFLPHPPYRAPRGWYGFTPREAVTVASGPASAPLWERAAVAAQQSVAEGSVDLVEMRATYLDACRFLDAQVARVLERLDALGLADDTVVLCWSDHGDLAGDRGLAEKWITAMLDCVTRIPAVLSVPGCPPRRVEALVEAIDLLPTALEACGVEVPRWVNGTSVAPAFDDAAAHRHYVRCDAGLEAGLADALARVARTRRGWKYRVVEQDPRTVRRAASVRTSSAKLVARAGGEWELYDLASDPHECSNVIAEERYAPLKAELSAMLVESWLEAADSLPMPADEELVL